MPVNDERRAAIAAASVSVLARDGLRGLTHRAVDAEAGLPVGTTSNYHRTRAALLEAAAAAALDRLRGAGTGPVGQGVDALVAGILGYVTACLADRAALLAWFELRLLAARDPGVDVATRLLADRHAANVALAVERGWPGAPADHRRLLHALDGILLAAATGSLDDAEATAAAEALVRALVPDAPQRRWFNLR